MSNSKGKKVHYERGTKGEKHSRHHSGDSGFGSSSASDRASLGTPAHDEPSFNYRQIQDQRLSLTALQEALDAANDKIRQLQSDNAKLNAALAESNRENRSLKKDRIDLMNKVEDLKDDLKDERKANENFRRASSPRTGGTSSAKTERRSTAPKRELIEQPRHHEGDRSQGSYSEHRQTLVPTATQAAPSQNPFLPHHSTRPSSVSYPPGAVIYAQAPISYTASPVHSSHPSSANSGRHPQNDGRYHLHPVN